MTSGVAGRAARHRTRPSGAAREIGDWPAPTLRWILAHMIEETARHCGHADLIREAIDGLVGEDPPGPPS